MTHLPSTPATPAVGTWSAFVQSDTAKVATFVAIAALLLVGTQPAGPPVRFAQFLCSTLALVLVALLSYRDRPRPAPARS